jgi:hypothetical protein
MLRFSRAGMPASPKGFAFRNPMKSFASLVSSRALRVPLKMPAAYSMRFPASRPQAIAPSSRLGAKLLKKRDHSGVIRAWIGRTYGSNGKGTKKRPNLN